MLRTQRGAQVGHAKPRGGHVLRRGGLRRATRPGPTPSTPQGTPDGPRRPRACVCGRPPGGFPWPGLAAPVAPRLRRAPICRRRPDPPPTRRRRVARDAEKRRRIRRFFFNKETILGCGGAPGDFYEPRTIRAPPPHRAPTSTMPATTTPPPAIPPTCAAPVTTSPAPTRLHRGVWLLRVGGAAVGWGGVWMVRLRLRRGRMTDGRRRSTDSGRRTTDDTRTKTTTDSRTRTTPRMPTLYMMTRRRLGQLVSRASDRASRPELRTHNNSGPHRPPGGFPWPGLAAPVAPRLRRAPICRRRGGLRRPARPRARRTGLGGRARVCAGVPDPPPTRRRRSNHNPGGGTRLARQRPDSASHTAHNLPGRRASSQAHFHKTEHTTALSSITTHSNRMHSTPGNSTPGAGTQHHSTRPPHSRGNTWHQATALHYGVVWALFPLGHLNALSHVLIR
jgi:hypothetical protein